MTAMPGIAVSAAQVKKNLKGLYSIEIRNIVDIDLRI